MKPQRPEEAARPHAVIDATDPPSPGWRRTNDRQAQPARRAARLPMSFTEADKYRWIMANRSSFDLTDALRDACSDAEFDALVESAMRMSVASPSYFGEFDDVAHA
jgi:hypothetical protein